MRNKFLIAVLLVIGICLTGCDSKLSEVEIKEMLEVDTAERTFTINKISYASDIITINDIDM